MLIQYFKFTKKHQLILCIFFYGLLWGPQFGWSEDWSLYRSKLWSNLETICEFGPRYPGSPGHQKIQDHLIRLGNNLADDLVVQDFQAVSESGEVIPRMKNIELRFGERGGRPFLLGAHYDTRPRSDEENDPSARTKPILGANDGGSGTAVLLALAEVFHETPPEFPIHLVFFDGEDWGEKGSLNYLLGSKHYARSLKFRPKNEWPQSVLVLDMVGDKNLEIYRESYSSKSAPHLLNQIYELAYKKFFFPQFKTPVKYSIMDDHIPFSLLNIPSAVLIDFDYPHWHKLTDTLEQCSAESLLTVFSLVAELIYNWKP